MNLGKLLGAGKSFFGGGRAAAYRLKKGLYLPRFNEGRNPFVPKAAEAVPGASQLPDEVPAAPPAPARKSPPPYAFKPAGRPATPASPAAVKPARTGWTTRLNPFRAPEPAAVAAAVQAELSLDSIKVMHNDLADAEVEVVPVKSHAETPAAAMLPPARQAWEFLGENLMKSS